MSDLNWEKVETIIDQVLELPEEERRSFIDTECGDNPKLKSEVTLLLESIFDSEGWLDNPNDYKREFYDEISDDVELITSEQSLIGKTVGSYTIKEKIGEGGMGVVYRAERTDGTFDHRVAIKIIRHSRATEENLRRFKQEQRILAGLNHTGIARLFDGGVTSDGSPYIIMEYVNGTPIDDYCRDKNCIVDEKIALFRAVLDAVRYAHENLVIHRDLKPSNILVDEDENVKILDFGISKLLDEENSAITQTGARLLTPRYAAPEQIRQKNITTATDLYALGIVFYELLCGDHCLDLTDLSRYEIEQKIINQIASKPSAKVSNATLRKRLQGDLDAIALKAIRKEKEQRYRVANEFLDDLKNYQNGRPVSAREDSLKYRSHTFFKRNKKVVAAAVGLLLLIIGFAGFYTWRVAQERDRAQFQAQRAEQVKSFMLDIFNSSNPELAEHSVSDLKATQLLQYGINKVENDLQNQPEVYIEMMTAIGDALANLDDFENAERALLKALDRSTAFNGENMQTAAIYSTLANLKNNTRETENAKVYISEALSIAESSKINNNYNLAHYNSILAFSNALEGKFITASKIYLKADSLYITSGNKQNVHRFTNLDNLAEVERRLSKFKLAEEHLKQTLNFYQNHYQGPHVNTASSLMAIGSLYSKMGRYEEANRYLLESVEMNKKLLGEENTSIAESYETLSLNYVYTRDIDNALFYARKNIEIKGKVFGENSIPYSGALNNLGMIYQKDDRLELARKYYEESLLIKETLLQPENPALAIAYYNMGALLKQFGEYRRAVDYLRRTLEIDKVAYGPEAVDIGIDNTKLGSILTLIGNYKEADSLFTAGREIYLQKLPENHKRIAENLVEHGKLDHRKQWYKPAISKFEKALEIYVAIFDESDPRIQETKQLLANVNEKVAAS